MRTELEVRRRLAEANARIDATPLRKPVQLAVRIAERAVLRWVLGELGSPPSAAPPRPKFTPMGKK